MKIDKNVRVIIDIPDHPHALAAMTRALDILGQTITDLAAKDLRLEEEQPVSDIPEMNRQGEMLHSKEWTEYLHEISTTYELIGERATDKWIEHYGDDHPLSVLAKKARSGMTKEEFFEAVRNTVEKDPDVMFHIGSIDLDDDLDSLIERVKRNVRRDMR